MNDTAPMPMTDRWVGEQAPIVGLYTNCPNPMTVPCRPRNELDMPGVDGHRPYTDDSPSMCHCPDRWMYGTDRCPMNVTDGNMEVRSPMPKTTAQANSLYDRYTDSRLIPYKPDDYPTNFPLRTATNPPYPTPDRYSDVAHIVPGPQPHIIQPNNEPSGQVCAGNGTPPRFATDSNQLSPLGDSYPARHRRKHKEPMKYNGKTDLEDYLGYFAAIAQWNYWDEEEKGMQLACSLIEGARGVLSTIPCHLQYQYVSLVSALRRKYSPPPPLVECSTTSTLEGADQRAL